MAKLSTPFHQCSTVISGTHGEPLGHCPRPAYKRWSGLWYCRNCAGRLQSTVWHRRTAS